MDINRSPRLCLTPEFIARGLIDNFLDNFIGMSDR
jgi:hypothetical protein